MTGCRVPRTEVSTIKRSFPDGWVVALAAILLLPAPALAQNAEIAGAVRDESGAVLPGVTVEASSPALIERTRVVLTDGQGQVPRHRAQPRRVQNHVHASRLPNRRPRGDRADRRVHCEH